MDKENKLPNSWGNIQEELYKMALENIRMIVQQRDDLDATIKTIMEVSGESHADVINHLKKLKKELRNEKQNIL